MSTTNLGKSNNYWLVVRPFTIFVRVGFKPSNASYGSSRIHAPVYEERRAEVSDEIHNLHGGLFWVSKRSRQGLPVRTTPYEFRAFEKQYWPEEIDFPLSCLKSIHSVDAKSVTYTHNMKEIDGS